MKKEINISIAVLIGFLAFLWLEKPLREFLSETHFEEQIAELISSIFIRVILIGAIVFLINKLHHVEFAGLHSWWKFKNLHAVLIALVFVGIGSFSNWNTYTNSPRELLLLFTISTVVVGIVEEFTFRGVLFPLFIKSFANAKSPILISAILSSFMFGLTHFLNLLHQPGNIVGITSQVFFATSIGVFFCGLMVRTENILLPSLVHALINLSFGAGKLKPIEEAANVVETSGINWNSLIPTTIFFSIIFMGGVYMILKSDKQIIVEKLKVKTVQ